jgi:hypothetical protein
MKATLFLCVTWLPAPSLIHTYSNIDMQIPMYNNNACMHTLHRWLFYLYSVLLLLFAECTRGGSDDPRGMLPTPAQGRRASNHSDKFSVARPSINYKKNNN